MPITAVETGREAATLLLSTFWPAVRRTGRAIRQVGVPVPGEFQDSMNLPVGPPSVTGRVWG
jgi:hypothetical protein